MNNYSNQGGNSNITGYEHGIADGVLYIKVQFQDGSVYTYTGNSCGVDTIREMRSLADAGSGLNSYISRNRPKYESKS